MAKQSIENKIKSKIINSFNNIHFYLNPIITNKDFGHISWLLGQIDSLAELNNDDDAFIYLQKNLPQFCNDYRKAYEIINNFIDEKE